MVHDLCALILYNKGLDPGLNITMNLWTDSSNMYSFVNCSFTKDRTFPCLIDPHQFFLNCTGIIPVLTSTLVLGTSIN